jgi:hypothetical protein
MEALSPEARAFWENSPSKKPVDPVRLHHLMDELWKALQRSGLAMPPAASPQKAKTRRK